LLKFRSVHFISELVEVQARIWLFLNHSVVIQQFLIWCHINSAADRLTLNKWITKQLKKIPVNNCLSKHCSNNYKWQKIWLIHGI
jgi:hypothetical protein